jgi:pentatricopeptide repeat protein
MLRLLTRQGPSCRPLLITGMPVRYINRVKKTARLVKTDEAAVPVFAKTGKRIFSPQRAIWGVNRRINYFASQGQLEEAEKEFARFDSELGLKPDVISYGSLMKAYIVKQEFGQAEGVFQKMQQAGVQPSEVINGMLLKVLVLQGKHQQAHQLYAQLKESGKVSRKGLTGFIENPKTQLAEAEKVYADMLASGQADRGAANAMLRAYVNAGELDKAKKMFHEMKASKKAEAHPNLRSYESLLMGYLARGDFDAALAVYRDMRHNRVSPRANFYHLLIKGLASHNQIPKAYEQLEEMRKENVFVGERAYGALIDGCLAAGNLDAAVAALHAMRDEARLTAGKPLLMSLRTVLEAKNHSAGLKEVDERLVALAAAAAAPAAAPKAEASKPAA